MLTSEHKAVLARIGEPLKNADRTLEFVNRTTEARVDRDSKLYLIGFVFPKSLFVKDFTAGWTFEITMDEFEEHFEFEPIPFNDLLEEVDKDPYVEDVIVRQVSEEESDVAVYLQSGAKQEFRVSQEGIHEARDLIFDWISKFNDK